MLDSIEKIETLLNRLGTNNKVARKLLEEEITKEDVGVRRDIINRIISYLQETEFFLEDDVKTFATKPLKKLKKHRREMRKMLSEKKSLSDLEKSTSRLIEWLEDELFVLKKVQEVKEFYNFENQPHISDEDVSKVGKLFKSDRKTSVLDFRLQRIRGERFLSINNGKLLRDFLDNSNIAEPYSVTTARTFEAEEAYDNGIDFVAKYGIQRKRHNTFDIGILKQDFFDVQHSATLFGIIDASDYLRDFFTNNFLKSDGYYIFNIPQSLFHRFIDRFYERNGRLKLKFHHVFRTDDEMDNLLFVAQQITGDKRTETLIRTSLFQHNRLPHIDDIDEKLYHSIDLSRGEFVDPEIVPQILDDNDLTREFGEGASPFEEIAEYLKPVEKAVEINNPLQEYKVGHLPSVSTTEITNGLYDSHQFEDMVPTGIKYDHLFSAKIIQKDVIEKEKEKYRGEIVDMVTDRKKNVIVMNILDNDGREIELLNTED